MGHAPLTLKLKKKASHVVRIEQEGYDPVELSIGTKKSGIGALAVIGDLMVILAAGFAANYLEWQAAGEPDEEPAHVRVSFLVGVIGASIGLAILEGKSSARYSLEPHEISVALTKIHGFPRVATILVDADEFRHIKWIRIHGNKAPELPPL